MEYFSRFYFIDFFPFLFLLLKDIQLYLYTDLDLASCSSPLIKIICLYILVVFCMITVSSVNNGSFVPHSFYFLGFLPPILTRTSNAILIRNINSRHLCVSHLHRNAYIATIHRSEVVVKKFKCCTIL